MERKKTVETKGPKKPRWRKITRGTLYPFPEQRNISVKVGEIIEATEEEIEKYCDQFESVREFTGKHEMAKSSESKPGLNKRLTVTDTEKPPLKSSIKNKDLKLASSGPGKEKYTQEQIGENQFNILSAAGKVMNDTPLTSEEAKTLKDSLEHKTIEPE